MKGEDAATAIPISIPSPPPATVRKDAVFGRNVNKFWVLMALLLLASWSMFTVSVSLKWSASNLAKFNSDHADLSIYDDLDILELEQSEKVVRKMWDAYTEKPDASLRRFWQEAFEAAYEYLSSEVPGVRDAAVAEIAKLSMRSSHLPGHPTVGKILSFY